MFDGGESTDRSTLIRESVRLMIGEALEVDARERWAEATSNTARPLLRIAPATAAGSGRRAEGEIEYGVPQVRGVSGWRSEFRAAVSGRSEELERLAIEMHVPDFRGAIPRRRLPMQGGAAC